MPMTAEAPVSRHLDLYRYWEGKRGNRHLPTRRDIDPTEIPRLLPHIALIDALHGTYRWRLVGTQIVDDLGCDLTGQPFGTNVAPHGFVSAMSASFDRVLSDGEPVFEESLYATASGRTHALSRLLLPLGTGDKAPAMILFTQITRRTLQDRALNYIKGASGQVGASFGVRSLEDLERRVAVWEHDAEPPPIARIFPQPILRIANLWGQGFAQVIQCGSGKAVSLRSASISASPFR
jgi:hypothetical protein